MAFDSNTRNKLARTIAQARQLLVEEFTQQLQEIYGIQPDGTKTEVEKLTHLDDQQASTARFLREKIEHLVSGMTTEKKPVVAAVDRIIREQAFTILNRFAALRMCEERGFVEECVREGMQSKGFKIYETVAGAGLGDIYERYKTFLFCLFDEIAVDLGVLFDRFSPYGLLFPREQALLELLTIINNGDLKEIWAEDETIGWVYQYFNSKEEREAMRKASSAPGNSRELAVRNQFFTPRYVVEFLTDNTLGRIWYEMRQGDTRLKEDCRYLVCRPNEIFLKPGEMAPDQGNQPEELSQEELLKQPDYIPHRPKKDPRDLKILDPACGSGHFLLYCFDLLETVYGESYEDLDLGPRLKKICPTIDDLKRDLPALILRHNLHGIDIDPRAVQIAALALWLRAQRTYKQLRLKPAERPRVTKTNIVCAEPMPGEAEMLREFTTDLKPRVLGQIVEVIFEKMKLAGEAGSLLKIEEQIQEAISHAKLEYQKELKRQRDEAGYLPGMAPPREPTLFDFVDLKDEEFWNQAEERIVEALRKYSERAENGQGNQRRLFAEDSVRGFAFVDLCRKRYDVVLMNPPFGLPTEQVFQTLRLRYKGAHNDIYCSFVRWALNALESGRVGVITSRSFLLAPRLEDYRRNDVIPNLELLLDFGLGVMDDAYVESAAYVLNNKRSEIFHAFDLRGSAPDHQFVMNNLLENETSYLSRTDWFYSLPKAKILYSAPPTVRQMMDCRTTFEPTAGTAREGMKSFNNVRFLRLWWEVLPSSIGRKRHWIRLAKGGGFSFFYSDMHLLLNWSRDGLELQAVNQSINGSTAQVRQASDYWYLPGVTYSKRSAKGFSARALPAACIFTSNGPAVLPHGQWSPAFILGWLNSKPVRAMIHMQANFADYSTGALKKLPWKITINNSKKDELERSTVQVVKGLRSWKSLMETSPCFSGIQLNSLNETGDLTRIHEQVQKVMVAWDLEIASSYGFSDLRWADEALSEETDSLTDNEEDEENADAVLADRSVISSGLLAHSVGWIFGRWDVRVTLDPSLAPKLPDPFDPLPVCPPAMLVGSDGLPAKPGAIASEEWLRARPDAISLPPDGTLDNATISDDQYPLRISWDGILVDDSGFNGGQPHKEDIVRRVREVSEVLWEDRAEAIELEACEILGVRDLRDYFRRPSGFFQDHLKRYSKSRRKAPIYWPISTSSGSYTLWIYYHRLSDQTLFTCVNDYVNSKLDNVSKDIKRLQDEVAKGGTAQKRQRLEELMDFEQELKDFRDELLRVVELPYKPDLNDGVMITAAPLWKLFRHNQWRKDLGACWQKLEAGQYDWAHLAYAIWPERVREKCKVDRSIAIAHDLEDFYQGDLAEPRKRTKKATG